jgi:hypothetical protein
MAGNVEVRFVERERFDEVGVAEEDFADAANYYGQKTRETMDSFKDGFNKAKDAVSSAWRNNNR